MHGLNTTLAVGAVGGQRKVSPTRAGPREGFLGRGEWGMGDRTGTSAEGLLLKRERDALVRFEVGVHTELSGNQVTPRRDGEGRAAEARWACSSVLQPSPLPGRCVGCFWKVTSPTIAAEGVLRSGREFS